MKAISIFLLCAVLAVMASLATSQPVDNNAPSVSVLRYRNDQDLEAIQRAIIAQYNQIGGTTQVHTPLKANVIDPSTLRINI